MVLGGGGDANIGLEENLLALGENEVVANGSQDVDRAEVDT